MNSDRTESHYSRLQHPIEGSVHRQLVEVAREPVGPGNMVRNLPADVQLTAEQEQVVLALAIAVREPAPYGSQ